MHYFQHNIADYRKDTAHLTLLEHGAYRQLLDQYYLNEAPFFSVSIKMTAPVVFDLPIYVDLTMWKG